MARASNSSKLSKLAGPSMKAVMGADFSWVDPGRDVDQDEGVHQVRRVGGQRDGGQAAEGHADDAVGPRGASSAIDPGQVHGVGRDRKRAVGPAVGVAVPGEVDGQERTVEGEGDGVPGVGVLGPAVDEDELPGLIRCPSAGC